MQSHVEGKSSHAKNDNKWVTLEDPRFVETVLKSLGDEDKKNIINAVMDEPKIISDIIKISKIAQTSGYRKVNLLIDDGLLIPRGYLKMNDGKIITKYTTIFDNINIVIEKNKVIVKILPKQYE